MALVMHWGFEASFANINDGYVEALARGYRSGLLTSADFNNLSQCENLDDVKLHLARVARTAAGTCAVTARASRQSGARSCVSDNVPRPPARACAGEHRLWRISSE